MEDEPELSPKHIPPRTLARRAFRMFLVTDLTPDWAPFAAERLAAWRQNKAAYASGHGEGAYQAQNSSTP